MVKIDKQKFIDACIQVNKDHVRGTPIRLKGRNHDERYFLKPTYSALAKKYMYHEEVRRRRYFSAEQILRLCIVLGVPIEDLIFSLREIY